MITIIFEAHSTTLDNEVELSFGHNDVALSRLGREQARDLGERYAGQHFDAIFCSDLQRSYRTAEIAFGSTFPIIKDKRLRECDYGDLTQKPAEIVTQQKPKRIFVPFPNGESYEQACARIRLFLDELKKDYDGKTVMIIGHRATQYGLEHVLNSVPIIEAVAAPWHWQPGWCYEML